MAIIHYKNIREITGDILKLSVPAPEDNSHSIPVPKLDDLALIHSTDATHPPLLAQVTHLQRDIVTLQIYGSTKGLSTDSSVSFLGHPMLVNYSANILGRIFNGIGQAIDNGPKLEQDDKIPIRTATVNPTRRTLASKMIRTNIPTIDVFNCLVESQKMSQYLSNDRRYCLTCLSTLLAKSRSLLIKNQHIISLPN